MDFKLTGKLASTINPAAATRLVNKPAPLTLPIRWYLGSAGNFWTNWPISLYLTYDVKTTEIKQKKGI